MPTPKIITALIAILIMLIASQGFCLDPASKDAAKSSDSLFKSQVGSGDAIKNRLFNPLTQENTQLSTIDNTKTGDATTFCGQGSVQNEKLAVEVTVSASSITVRTDTNNDGILDSNNSFSGISKVCIDGYRVGTTSWYRWNVSGSGYVSSVSSGELNGCLDPLAQPPTYAGGAISKLYAEATGKMITNSSFSGYTATYYAGEVKDCAGQNKDTPETKYFNNPYTMTDAAMQKTVVCGANSTDPSCQAYTGVKKGGQNFAGTSGGTVSCSITRNIIDQKGPQNGIICEANSLYYAAGYSDSNKICYQYPQSRWDYNSMFRARCDSYGKALSLEAWAYWEGAPCGVKANHPPDVQIKRALPYGGSSNAHEIGRFSVNRRMDGDNTAYNDMGGDTRCWSVVNPMKVWLSHNCAFDNSYCTYSVNVDNAPACNTFSITVSPPVGETIDDGCAAHEQNNCKIIDEWYYDAQNNRVQTIINGNPTNNTLGTTCKSYPTVGTVCKPWWRIERTYECKGSSSYTPHANRVKPITDTADNMNSDKVSYQKPTYNKDTTPTCIVEIDYALEPYSNSNAECQARGGKMDCPKGYSYNSAVNKCQEQPSCPLNFTFNSSSNRCEKDPPCPCQANPVCGVGSQYNSTTKKCEKNPVCVKVEYFELECKYDVPATKTGLHCTINDFPPQQYERKRDIHRGCKEPEQCRIGCVLQIPDTSHPKGYRHETRDCNKIGNDQYSCPNGGYSIIKNCNCIIDSFDPEELKGDDCEISCMVSKPSQPQAQSNVKDDYLLKTCDKSTVNGSTIYKCPLSPNEKLYKDCACPDGFGLSAGVLSALVEAVNDRECLD